MKIIIGSDHRGYGLKESIKKSVIEAKNVPVEWIDVGTNDGDRSVDYPVIAKKVCGAILDGQVERGVVICGSGVGVSIAANRFPRIYAALCWSPAVAKAAREHGDANVLALSANFIDPQVALQIVQVWLSTEFLGGKYQLRLEMLDRK